jgi:iron(III) transport system ATP-binding protein
MDKGRIKAIGTAHELYRRPKDLFTARFFSELNEIPADIRNGRAISPIGAFDAPGLAEGAAAVVCLRPAGLRLRPPGFCLPGRLVARRHLGEVDMVDVVVAGLDRPLIGRLREPTTAQPGQDVGVDVDPNEVLVFAANGP